MEDNDTAVFKMSGDDDDDAPDLPSSRAVKEVDAGVQAGKKKGVSLVSIFIAVLLSIGIGAVVYWELNKKIVELQNAGKTNVQNLSQDVETRAHALLTEQKKLNEAVEERFTAMGKTLETMRGELKKSQKAATSAQKKYQSFAVKQKAVDDSMIKLEKSIAIMQENIIIVVEKTGKLEEDIRHIDFLSTELTNLQNSISQLFAATEENKKRYAAIAERYDNDQNTFEAYRKSDERQMVSLEKRIVVLEKQAKQLESSVGKWESRHTSQTAPSRKGAAVNKEIIEQNINE